MINLNNLSLNDIPILFNRMEEKINSLEKIISELNKNKSTKIYDVHEAAIIAKESAQNIRKAILEGRLLAISGGGMGSKYRINSKDLEDYLNNHDSFKLNKAQLKKAM